MKIKHYKDATIEERAEVIAYLVAHKWNDRHDHITFNGVSYHLWNKWLDTDYFLKPQEFVDLLLEAQMSIDGLEGAYEEIYDSPLFQDVQEDEFRATLDNIRKPDFGVKPSKIAAFVVATAMLEADDCNYCVYFDKITKKYGDYLAEGWNKSEEFLKEIQKCVEEYPVVSNFCEGCEIEDDCFSLNIYTDYIADVYDAGEEEEEDD